MSTTDQWGGVSVDEPKTDQWGGMAVEDSPSAAIVEPPQKLALPSFESPISIGDQGPVYRGQQEAQQYGSLSTSDLSTWQKLRRTGPVESLLGPPSEELEAMGGVAGSRTGVVPTLGATAVLLPVGFGQGRAGVTMGKALMGYFTEEFIRQQPAIYEAAKQAYDRGDWSSLRNIVTQDVLGGAMTAVGAKQTFFPGKGPALVPPEPELFTEPVPANMRRAQVTTDRLALPPARTEALTAPVERLALTEGTPESVKGGAESDLSPAGQARSKANNSIQKMAEANGVEFVEGDTPQTIFEKIKAKATESAPEAPRAVETPAIAASPNPEEAATAPETAAPGAKLKKKYSGEAYRAGADEFKRLVMEHGEQMGWIKNPDFLNPTAEGYAMISHNTEMKKAYRRALKDIGITAETIPLKLKHEALPKLKEFLAKNAKLEPVALTEMPDGSEFTILGEKYTVKGTNPDTGIVTIKDGRTLKVDENHTVKIDPGSLKAKEVSTEFAPEEKPDLKLGDPETVEQQKARLAQEEEARKKKSGQEQLAGKAAAPLVGSMGDIGQGDLLGGGDLFSAGKKPAHAAPEPKMEGKPGKETDDAFLKRVAPKVDANEKLTPSEKKRYDKLTKGPEQKPSGVESGPGPAKTDTGIGASARRRLASDKNRIGESGGGVPLLQPTIKKTHDTIKTLAKTKGIRDVMAYTKDVAGNVATVYGQRVGNNVRGELKRAMGRGSNPNVLDENALTFVREADGDRSQLAIMRGKLTASTVANPKWKSSALKAIDHAEANWDRLNPIASQYEGATDAQIAAENASGINTLSRKGYVMHAQDVQNDFGFFDDVAGEGSTGFKHARAYNTFADSIAAGVDPKSINAVALLTQRVARGQMLINNRMWVEGLKTTIDPKTRKSVVTEPEIIPRGPGLPPDVRAPTDYVTEIAGGRPIAILKPYAGIFRALTEPSKFSESLGWNATLKVATTGKHVALMLDTFHLGRIAFWESVIKPLSLTDPKLPLPSYKKGVLTLDYSNAELQRMAASGEIDPAKLNALLDAKRDIDGLVKHGYNVAKISDQLHQEWLQKIPITGQFNKWLFNQFQRGAMAEVGSLEVGRYRRMHPSWTDEQVYREVAKDLNTRFGNLGRQGILKSKTAQDTARMMFLAPQWNEGLIRSELGAVTGAVKGVGSSIKEKRLSFGILPRAVGAMLLGQFAANQIINYITRGKPTWENEEEGMGAKLSAWIPDVVGGGPGFFLHPAGLAAEITHLLSSKYEKKGDVRDAIIGFMGGRWSTMARPLMTFLTRRDMFQRLIRPENIWKETAKSAFPAPIGASAAVPAIRQQVSGEKKEAFPGQYQKQLMASAGVKTDQAPSPGQRMQVLAGEFRNKKGIKESGEFYESAYVPLRQALQRGAVNEARQAYDDLIKSDHKPKQIENAVKPWTGGNLDKNTLEISPRHAKPFTGSSKHEQEFLNGLNPEQRNTAKAAYEQRVKTFKLFQEMLRSAPKESDEFGGIPVE